MPKQHVEPLECRTLLAFAQGDEFHVNQFTTGFQGDGDVGMDADGDFVVTWSSNPNSSNVFARMYDAAGVPKGDEFQVNTFTSPDAFQRFPRVAVDADGDFAIVWASKGQDGSGYGVYGQRYDAQGVAQGGEFLCNSQTAGHQSYGEIGMDADGNFVVTWCSKDLGASTYNVFGQRFNADGIRLGGEFQVNTHVPLNLLLTLHAQHVAVNADGRFVITWNGAGPDDTFGIYARMYDPSGVPQGNQFRVNSYTTGGQNRPDVAINAAGDFAVSWVSSNQNGEAQGIYAQHYDASGAPVGGEIHVNTSSVRQSPKTSIAMRDAGDFVVTWEAAAGYEVTARQFDATGVPQGGEFVINSTILPSVQEQPAIAMNAAGDFVVAWQSTHEEPARDMYARRFSLIDRPIVVSSQFVWNDSPQRIEIAFDRDVSANLSPADVVLENLSTATTIPTANIALSYHAATNTATFTFPGYPFGALPDGRYDATLTAVGVTSSLGDPIITDHHLSFFVLAGDADRSGNVNVDDFNILATNFGTSGKIFSQGNFNYDAGGFVNLDDFNILATNFGISLGSVATSARKPAPFGQNRIAQTRDDALAELWR